jgi:inosine-uridine nucleoside N-ribohydrolase
MTVIDWRGRSGRPANAQVIEAADADGIYRLLAGRLSTQP